MLITCLLCVADTVPEFLLNAEDDSEKDDDDDDVDIDVGALSPMNEPPWSMTSGENDRLPAVDDILSSFTGLYYITVHLLGIFFQMFLNTAHTQTLSTILLFILLAHRACLRLSQVER